MSAKVKARRLCLVFCGTYKRLLLNRTYHCTALRPLHGKKAFALWVEKENRGKLASCMFLLHCECQRGQKHCSPKKTKTKKKKVKEEIDSKRKKQKLLHICRDCQTARQNTSESCACPERLWQVLG